MACRRAATAQGLRPCAPSGLSALPLLQHGFVPKPWADGLRPLHPPTAAGRQPNRCATVPRPELLRRAFSFVEVILAIGLAGVVILVAAAAFRTATGSIGLMTRTSEENRLLRSGIIAALDDLDHWSSDADPAFPHGRAYAAFRNVSDDGLNRLADAGPINEHGNNRRPFRRVDFANAARDLDADGRIDAWESWRDDPNWVVPHDPAAWYRGHLLPNARPVRFDISSQVRYRAPAMDGNRRFDSWMYSPPSGNTGLWGGYNFRIPGWWNPRLCFGDYANMANSSTDPADYDAGLGLGTGIQEARLRGSRGSLMQALLRELGPVGMVNYLPPGNLLQFLRPTTNLYSGGPNWDRGEIPWMLDAPRVQQGSGDWQTGTAVPAGRRLDLAEALAFLGGYHATDAASAMADRALVLGTSLRADYPFATLHSAARRGWLDQFTTEPQRAYVRSQVAHAAAELLRNDTSLLPLGLSGQSGVDLSHPADRPTMALSSYRYRFRSGEVCNLAVTLNDPRSGRTTVVGFTATGTTYRGARQLWALRTWGQDFGADGRLQPSGLQRPAMGDWYAP